MTQFSLHLLSEPTVGPRFLLAHFSAYLRLNARALRVAILLALLLILNFMDLTCTLFANAQGMLNELNPIAANLFSMELTPSVICFKALSCLVGVTLLWRLRSCPWTTPSCWLLVAIYAALAVRWFLWTQNYVEMMQSSEFCRITSLLHHHA